MLLEHLLFNNLIFSFYTTKGYLFLLILNKRLKIMLLLLLLKVWLLQLLIIKFLFLIKTYLIVLILL